MNDVIDFSGTTPTQITGLTKHHIKRLREHFEHSHMTGKRDGIDLDLVGWGLYKVDSNDSQYHYGLSTSRTLTANGIRVLHEHRRANIEARNIHHDLGSRLANHLRLSGRMTWENVEFRNKVVRETVFDGRIYRQEYWQIVRPDVFSMNPSLNVKTFNPCVHEIKVSRADFLADIAKPEKRQAYEAFSEAVYYVAPEGVIQPHEVPYNYGLVVERKPGEFVLVKRPKKRKVVLQPQHYLNLIIKSGEFPPEFNGEEVMGNMEIKETESSL